MKIILFGGTFDPLHNEHVNILAHAAAQIKPDRIFVLPAKTPPHKSGFSPAEVRREMARIGFAKIEGAELSDYELNSEGKSYSVRTVEHFRKKFKKADIYFLVGGDSLRDFFSWKEPERIAKLCTLTVAKRRGSGDLGVSMAEYGRRTGRRPYIINYTGDDVSSTELRVLIAYGIDVSKYVPPEALAYIEEKNLYRERSSFIRETAKYLSEKRYRHTAYTVACAMSLAGKAGVNPVKVFLATALHDVAKKMTPDQLATIGYNVDPEMPEPVVHAFAGAYVAEKCFGIRDPEILSAIRFHTTGRPDMTPLEKVVYTADCVEKSRDYEGVERLRRAVEKNFEEGFIACLKQTMLILSRKEGRKEVSKLTAEAYEYYENTGEIE